MSSFKDFFQHYTSGLLFVLAKTQVTASDGSALDMISALGELVERFKAAHEAGGKLLFIGNGGSAAVASHQAFDYWKNGKIRAMCFNDAALLTAAANDFGLPEMFAKSIEMIAAPQDIVIAISSSGQSANILNGARAGKTKGCAVVTFSAFKSDNPLRSLGDVNIYLDTLVYGHAEIGHETILHAMLDYHISTMRV